MSLSWGGKQSKRGSGSLVVWRGKSLYDGAPIMVSLVATSDNQKTGNMAQVFVMRQDVVPFGAMKSGLDYSVCGKCSLRPDLLGGCYVPTVKLRAHWDKVSKQPVATAEEVAIAAGLRPIRLGAYGDMAAVPAKVTDMLVAIARGKVTNYTHGQWTLGFDAIDHMRRYTMLSVESLDEAHRAWQRGWRTYRMLDAGEKPARGEILCPYNAIGQQCYDCLRCGGHGNRGPSIVVPVHGGDGVERKALRVIRGAHDT